MLLLDQRARRARQAGSRHGPLI
eukprot:COSAG06_NODE_39934_length_407_cov_0.866883_1_plen_22_part_01